MELEIENLAESLGISQGSLLRLARDIDNDDIRTIDRMTMAERGELLKVLWCIAEYEETAA